MQFKWHLLFGFVASYIFVEFLEFSLLAGVVIFLSSVLIDIGHYFWYGFETSKWNPFRAIGWYIQAVPKWKKLSQKEKLEFKGGIYVLHDISFWIVLIILSLFYNFAILVLIGITIHMVADFAEIIVRREPIYHKLFYILTIRKNKNKKSLTKL